MSAPGGMDLGGAFGGSGSYDLGGTSATGAQSFDDQSTRSVGGNSYRSSPPDNPINTYAMIGLAVLVVLVISKAVR